ncbi:hypothetical protein U27_04565 [Candidatus Vecturithrix granuli]|uniref:Uncharacterized protein n=1 Tax=Vecturithrix granuli TaxID=1499967 RepID=A0A081BZ43_VECG1|nr:hypothetical protein U27_04565 [Candidatus Vecturithrix granuli]
MRPLHQGNALTGAASEMPLRRSRRTPDRPLAMSHHLPFHHYPKINIIRNTVRSQRFSVVFSLFRNAEAFITSQFHSCR